MRNDTATLYHPNTGRAIEVAGRQADDWRALGWLDDAPEGDDGDQDPDNDAPEGDAPADPAGDEADAPAAAATKTTTRGRAKK